MNNNTLLLSIIVPVYNVEKYIERCLSSLLVPHRDDYEIIVVNDGTKDRSIEIIKERFQDPRIRIIEQENGGLSSARNHGISEAKGEYIWCFDSDDWAETEQIAGILENLHDIDLLYFNSYYNDYESSGIQKQVCLGIKARTGMGLARSGYAHCAPYYVIRKRVLEDNHLEFKEGILHEDSLFTPIMIVYCDKVNSFENPVYHYRIREGSITQGKATKKRLSDLVYVLKELIAFGKTHLTVDVRYRWGRCIVQILNELLFLSQKCNDTEAIKMVKSYVNRNWDAINYLLHGGKNNKVMGRLAVLSFGNLYGVYSVLHKFRYKKNIC